MPHHLRNDKFSYHLLRSSTVESNLISWKAVSTVPIYFHYISLHWIVGEAVRFIPLPPYPGWLWGPLCWIPCSLAGYKADWVWIWSDMSTSWQVLQPYTCNPYILSYGSAILVGRDLLVVEVSRLHLRHITLIRTVLDEWSARRRDLYLTKHNTFKRHILAPGGIRTHYFSKRGAADPHLRLRIHWDRL